MAVPQIKVKGKFLSVILKKKKIIFRDDLFYKIMNTIEQIIVC